MPILLLAVVVTGNVENCKNGSDGDETIDVGRSVERIEAHDVLALNKSNNTKK